MEKLCNNLSKNIEIIKKNFLNTNTNYYFLNIGRSSIKVAIIYDNNLIDKKLFEKVVLDSLSKLQNINIKNKNIIFKLRNHLPALKIEEINTFNKINNKIRENNIVILIEKQNIALSFEMPKNLSRSISEPSSEIALKGPKDSFVENYDINLGLIKRRIKSNKLKIREFEVGNYTKTKIGLLYIEKLANKEIIAEISNHLDKIDINGIIDSSNIKDFLPIPKYNIFPFVHSSERPDFASSNLISGKIILIIDNSPFAIILPGFFNDFIHSTEDYYSNRINISIIRAIRFFAFFLTIFTPGIYIAITTFNHETIPPDLLINFITQRKGVPFPTFIEAFAMLITFEMLKEADFRMPTMMGSAISIVGALVLGEASVNAGLVSPIMIIVVSITAISGLLIPSFELSNSVKVLRFFIMIMGSILGLYGIVIGTFILLIKMCSLNSFGVPYLAPFAPFSFQGQKDAILNLKKEKRKNNEKQN